MDKLLDLKETFLEVLADKRKIINVFSKHSTVLLFRCLSHLIRFLDMNMLTSTNLINLSSEIGCGACSSMLLCNMLNCDYILSCLIVCDEVRGRSSV